MTEICIVMGTRPEIIKLSPIIKYCLERKVDFFIINSNQHYSYEMDKIFFEDLELPLPKYNLGVGSKTHGNQVGNILIKTEEILMKEKPDVVLVQGDTNTTLGAALAATKLHIKVAHVEAGLRSYNRKMPEETNRIVTDQISDYLFCPTKIQEEILLNEGIGKEKIFVVGNTIADAVLNNIKIAEEKSKILLKLKLSPQKYMLVTAHRSLNVDIKENLLKLLEVLEKVTGNYKGRIIYSIHPRTKKMIKEFDFNGYLKNIDVIEPIGYFDFLMLEKNAEIILTDSGGLQEEACILGVPCITLRDETERPETVEAGANVVTGLNKDRVMGAINNFLKNKSSWASPYGKGNSAKKIIDSIIDIS